MDAEKEVFLHGNTKTKKKNEALVPGCIANGISEAAAITIWNKMAKFAEYAFNKSHAAGYSVISIRTAWLKYYYPKTFWTATLNSILGKADKIKRYISSATKDNIKTFAPSINHSGLIFTEEEDGIRMGLSALLALGKSATPIIEDRKINGNYSSISELIRRVQPNKSAIESLNYAGAFDEFGYSRLAVVSAIDDILAYKTLLSKNDSWCDTDEINEWYASMISLEINNTPEMDKQLKLQQEYKYAGMYVTEHPLDQYEEMLTLFSHSDVSDLVVDKSDDDEESTETQAFAEERNVVVVGVLKEVEKRLTKKGDSMLTGHIEDKTGTIKLTVFPKQFAANQFNFIEDNTVIVEGTWKNDDYGSQIIVSTATPLKEMVAPSEGKLFVLVDQDDAETLSETIVNKFGGYGPKLVVRASMASGRATMVFNKKSKKLEPCKDIKNLDKDDDVAGIDLSFANFCLIKEMVKDIAIRH